MTEYEIIGGDGKEYGPYPAEKIRGLLRENRLKPYSKIRPTQGDWTTVEALPEFAQPPVTESAQPPAQPTVATAAPYNPQPQIARVSPVGRNGHGLGDFHNSPRLLLWSYSGTRFRRHAGVFCNAHCWNYLFLHCPQTNP